MRRALERISGELRAQVRVFLGEQRARVVRRAQSGIGADGFQLRGHGWLVRPQVGEADVVHAHESPA
jgi:hypothetical protein